MEKDNLKPVISQGLESIMLQESFSITKISFSEDIHLEQWLDHGLGGGGGQEWKRTEMTEGASVEDTEYTQDL